MKSKADYSAFITRRTNSDQLLNCPLLETISIAEPLQNQEYAETPCLSWICHATVG